MNTLTNLWRGKRAEQADHPTVDFPQAANAIFEKALEDARIRLHPLIRNRDARLLDRHIEFVQAFRHSLEQQIGEKMAVWQPGVQAVFRFDESWIESRERWDGSIHLLVKVPHLSNVSRMLGKNLDKHLLKCLRQLGWSHFQKRHTVLEIQQVTPKELHHGIGYGAMFCAVHSRPVKIWPTKGWT